MTRLLGPDTARRTVTQVVGGNVYDFSGRTATAYLDSACTKLASIAAYDPANPTVVGATIPNSQVTLSAQNSRIPLFWFPENVDTLYLLVNTLSHTWVVTADVDSRLDVTPRADSTGRINPTATRRRAGVPRIMSLIAGTEDETLTGSNCTIGADTTNTRIGGRGWLMTMASAVTAYAIMSPVSPASSGLLTFPPAQAICLWMYVPDATKVNYIGVELSLNASNTVLWTQTNQTAPATTLVNGWNLIRLKTANNLANMSTWGQLNRIRVYATTSAATTITIGHVWLECPEKARLLMVSDAARKSLVTNGKPRLRAAGVPVTWGLDIALLGTYVGDAQGREFITEADAASLAAEGDPISFHSWDGTATSGMTAAQVRAETAKCLKWLQARGYAGRTFRAAWVQNLATNAAAVSGLLLGLPQNGVPSTLVGCWPPIDITNMERFYFYNSTPATIDAHFDLLQRTHGLSVTYNHGIWPTADQQSPRYDATFDEFDYWMTKVEAGIAAGWLEPVTFEQLWLESGGDFGMMGGDPVARYTDPAGNPVVKRIL